jgi:hypothetical protein
MLPFLVTSELWLYDCTCNYEPRKWQKALDEAGGYVPLPEAPPVIEPVLDELKNLFENPQTPPLHGYTEWIKEIPAEEDYTVEPN